MKMSQLRRPVILSFLAALTALSCGFPLQVSAPAADLQATRAILELQSTQLSLQILKATLDSAATRQAVLNQGTVPPTAIPSATNTPLPTAVPATATEVPSSTPIPFTSTASSTPVPTFAPTSTLAPTRTPTPANTLVSTARSTPMRNVENKKWQMTWLNIKLQATPLPSYTPEPGENLVALQIIFQNDSESSLLLDSQNFILVDANEQSWYPVTGGHSGEIAQVTLNQGEQVIGWVCFKTPPGIKVNRLIYQSPAGFYTSLVLLPF